MKSLLLASAMLLAGATSAHAQAPVTNPEQAQRAQRTGDAVERLVDSVDAAKARLALMSGVPEEVVRMSYPNAFPKFAAPSGPTTEAHNNCTVLANSAEARAKITEKLFSPAEPLNVANDMPEKMKAPDEKQYFFYLRDVYEKGDLQRQVKVRSSFQLTKAEPRDYLANGISCEVTYSTQMQGTIQLNKNWRGRADDGNFAPIINLNTSLNTVYEVKGVKLPNGKTDVTVRGLARVFSKG